MSCLFFFFFFFFRFFTYGNPFPEYYIYTLLHAEKNKKKLITIITIIFLGDIRIRRIYILLEKKKEERGVSTHHQ